MLERNQTGVHGPRRVLSFWLVLIVIGAIGRVAMLNATALPFLMAEGSRPSDESGTVPAMLDPEPARPVSASVAHTDQAPEDDTHRRRLLHAPGGSSS